METKKKQTREEKLKQRKLYREKNKEKIKKYNKEYHQRPKVKLKHKEYIIKYMREYSKRPEERAKKIIRMKSQRIYGKVPKGYQRHHINYDSPHNFILMPIQKHREIHEDKGELCTTQDVRT